MMPPTLLNSSSTSEGDTLSLVVATSSTPPSCKQCNAGKLMLIEMLLVGINWSNLDLDMQVVHSIYMEDRWCILPLAVPKLDFPVENLGASLQELHAISATVYRPLQSAALSSVRLAFGTFPK